MIENATQYANTSRKVEGVRAQIHFLNAKGTASWEHKAELSGLISLKHSLEIEMGEYREAHVDLSHIGDHDTFSPHSPESDALVDEWNWPLSTATVVRKGGGIGR